MNAALLTLLADPQYAGMSDADAAAAISQPVYTPRAQPVTLTTLSGNDCWGFPKTAAFHAALQLATSAPDATIAAQAAVLLKMLEGPGFYATDPQVAAMVPTFVSLGGGTVTLDDGNLAIGSRSYPAGAPVTTEDVNAARAQIARQAPIDVLVAGNRNRYNDNVAKLAVIAADPAKQIPATLADLDSLVNA